MVREKEFWRKVVELTFQPSYSGDLMDELFEELWELFARGEPWKIAEQAVQTLTSLKDQNYRLAVLSNNDSRLRSVLRELQVDHLFEHLFISSELGFEKPQREIFQAVEETLQVNPQRSCIWVIVIPVIILDLRNPVGIQFFMARTLRQKSKLKKFP